MICGDIIREIIVYYTTLVLLNIKYYMVSITFCVVLF